MKTMRPGVTSMAFDRKTALCYFRMAARRPTGLKLTYARSALLQAFAGGVLGVVGSANRFNRFLL